MNLFRISVSAKTPIGASFSDVMTVRSTSEEKAKRKVVSHLKEVFGAASKITYIECVDVFGKVSIMTQLALALEANNRSTLGGGISGSKN
jgi:hypothetical protein